MSSTLLEKLLGPEDETHRPAISGRALGLFMAAVLVLCGAVVGFAGYHGVATSRHMIHQMLNNNPPASFWDTIQ